MIFGPTAVGKTDTLSRLAGGGYEVIHADSIQVYRYLDIGTSKPPPDLLEVLPHHLIDIIEPDCQFSVGEFVRRADLLVSEIENRGNRPVMAGGTAFYLKSFIYGLPQTPAGNPEQRAALKQKLKTEGTAALREELRRVDPVSAERIAENDGYRLIRALEVYEATGRALSSFEKPTVPREDMLCTLIGLERDRQELYRRIDARVEQMFARGLPGEVGRLLGMGFSFSDPGLRGIGYREFEAYRQGCLTCSELKELIKRNTRRYAKRQITFFKSLPSVHWFHPDELQKIEAFIRGQPAV